MGNAFGKKMEIVMQDSASLVRGKLQGYCEKCDMMLMTKDNAGALDDKDPMFCCPRCTAIARPYTGSDHATRHQQKGGDPWQKSLSK